MSKMIRTLKTGLVAAVVGAIVVSGVAFAQTDESTDVTESPAYTRIYEGLSPLVEQGVITDSQADQIAAALAEAGPGFGHRRGHRGGGPGLDTAAEFLGMDVEDLRTQLHDGATLADIAGTQTDDLIAALVSDAQERVAQAVEEGRITQDEADEKLAEIAQRITDMVNGERPERPQGERGPGRGGPGRGFGPGGPGADAPAEDAVNA